MVRNRFQYVALGDFEHYKIMDDVVRHKLLDSAIRGEDSIRSALRRIDESLFKLGVIVDRSGRLLRTISDVDIRRALLHGSKLNDPVSCLPDKQPVAFELGTAPTALLDAMDLHQVNAVVLTDTDQRPVDVVDRRAISRTILLSPPHVGTTEALHVQRAFDDNWIAPAGPNLEAFEARLATVSSRRHAIALSSGTSGLHLALRALNLPKGARVYVSDLTFVGSIQPLFYEGLEPVLIDGTPGTWNMSVQALRRQIESDAANGFLGSAILVVHLYGQSADLAGILEVADAYGLPLIEDAAESLGAVYENRPSGAHGVIGVYSFNGNKIITTSSGGALVTDDAEIASRVHYLATQGRDTAEHYQHSTVAYNYRMSNILAGIGLGQLDVLADRVAARRAIFNRYFDALSTVSGVSFQTDSPNSQGNRWLTSIELDPNAIELHPYQIMRSLRAAGIETRPGWKPMHMQPLCMGLDFAPHSKTDVVSSTHFFKALCLPTGSSLAPVEQDRVISALRGILIGSLV